MSEIHTNESSRNLTSELSLSSWRVRSDWRASPIAGSPVHGGNPKTAAAQGCYLRHPLLDGDDARRQLYGLWRNPEVYVRLSRLRWADPFRIGDTAVAAGTVEADDEAESGFDHSNLIPLELLLWFSVFRGSSVSFVQLL